MLQRRIGSVAGEHLKGRRDCRAETKGVGNRGGEGGSFLLQLDTVDFSAGDLISVIRALKGSGISSQLEDQIGHI